MSMRKDWQALKAEAKGAGIEITKMLGKHDLGPKLDAFEKAEKALIDNRSDRKQAALKAAALAAWDDAAKVVLAYKSALDTLVKMVADTPEDAKTLSRLNKGFSGILTSFYGAKKIVNTY